MSLDMKHVSINVYGNGLRFVLGLFLWLKYTEGDTIMVCPGDDLNIQCPPEHVIVTSSAVFGRMEYNRCLLVQDVIGCENDVLFAIDEWCSGRQSCQVNNPTKELEEANKNCLAYVKKYLEISYTCLKVRVTSGSNCRVPVALIEREGFVSSHVAKQTGCGSLIVAGLPGQQITLNIIDFGSEILKMQNSSKDVPLYGYIEEGSRRTAFHAAVERERLLYQSDSDMISIELTNGLDNMGFLLHYQKSGCAELTPPAHAWYKRDGDQAVIGCEWSQKTWHLSCDGQSWSGVVGNCSEPVTQQAIHAQRETATHSALWLVCVVCVAVVLLVVACVSGVVCIKKYRIKHDVQKAMTMERLPGQGHYDLDPNLEMASMLYVPYQSCDHERSVDPPRPASYLAPQVPTAQELSPVCIWERPLPDLPDRPLASDMDPVHSSARRGRTPGDGDEAVAVSHDNIPQSHQVSFGVLPCQDVKNHSTLQTQNPQSNCQQV